MRFIDLFSRSAGVFAAHHLFTKRKEKIMAGKFVVYKGKDGKDYFRLKAGNGEVIFTGQGYASRKSCLNGIESVRKNSQDPERFDVRTAKDGRTYFVLTATNGQEVGRSQMYKSDSGCRNGMKSVTKNAADSAVVEE
jgi:uncharacterized protein YegP (UPF0339 family)